MSVVCAILVIQTMLYSVCVCLIQVVERTTKARAARRHEKIQEYFYGLGERLYPHIFDVRFSDIHIYKIGGSIFVYFTYQYCVPVLLKMFMFFFKFIDAVKC